VTALNALAQPPSSRWKTTSMLYRVKRLDPLVSFGTVYRFLTLLAASGLATTIPRERRGPLRFVKVTTPKQPGQCNHAHLVCKDCGAVVQAQVPEAEIMKPERHDNAS
jgi:Fe2+ or Zn2+ uptake regulation protein